MYKAKKSRVDAHLREERFLKVSALYAEGKSQYLIAQVLKVSRSVVAKDLIRLHHLWQTESIANINEAKNRELAKIDALERKAWIGLERSTGKMLKEESGTSAQGPFSKKVRWHEAGDPRWARVILDCIERRCAILGVDAPDKIEGKFSGNITVISAVPRPAQLPVHEN